MHTIVWEPHGIYLTLGEVISEEDIDSAVGLVADPRFDTIRYRITDYSKVIFTDFSEVDRFISLIAIQTHFNKSLLEAAITSNPEITRHLIENKELSVNPNHIKIFKTKIDALSWISSSFPH